MFSPNVQHLILLCKTVLKIMARTAHDNTFLIKISTLSLARRLIEKEKA